MGIRNPHGARRSASGRAVMVAAASVVALSLAAAVRDTMRFEPAVPDPPPGMVPYAEDGLPASRIRELPLRAGSAALPRPSPRRRFAMRRPPRLPLPDDVGPDWTVVQEYFDRRQAWTARSRELALADLTSEERWRRTQEAWGERPNLRRAIAAATAIVGAGGAHEKTVEAAEFLVLETGGEPDADWHLVAGTRALALHAPDFSRWPQVFVRLDGARMFFPNGRSSTPGADALIEEMAAGAPDPVLRAMARYHVAAGFMQSANGAWLRRDAREARRRRALDLASDLSAGVEQAAFDPFPGARRPDGSDPATFAKAEADLIHAIRHATVGGIASELTGRRLDDVEDRLSAHAGRTVLIVFWATGCEPCVETLPELRALAAELPADRFTLLAISVDDERETVLDFMENAPLPWTNWHAGAADDVVASWHIRALPTYVLVGAQGEILARGSGLHELALLLRARLRAG